MDLVLQTGDLHCLLVSKTFHAMEILQEMTDLFVLIDQTALDDDQRSLGETTTGVLLSMFEYR